MNNNNNSPYETGELEMDFEKIQQEKVKFLEEQNEKIKVLKQSYNKVFNTKDGISILSNLHDKFSEQPSYAFGYNINDTCYIEGQKSVIRYIEKLLSV